jgi:Reverse transcriptase (RNA-dependent DNA polymerase)
MTVQNRGDELINELQNEKQQKIIDHDHRVNSWITEYTWQLIDKKAEARRIGNIDETVRLKYLIRKSLRNDRRKRAEDTANEIEGLLINGNVRAAYEIIRKWQKNTTNKPPIPTYMDAEILRNEYQILYTQQQPIEHNITLFNNQAQVDDTVPDEEEIKSTLKGMKFHKSPGCTGISVEDLRLWMDESEQEIPQRERWEKVIEIVQSAFTRTNLPQVFGIGILVLIPKNEPNQFRGIALLDVIYKLISRIISVRINDSILYHDAIHGFRRERGTTTAISELKLYMRATTMNKKAKPRFIIFLDLKKAYDTLDRTRTLEILKSYGVGPNICHIIEQTWVMDQMIPKQAGCYGDKFKTSRGVRQGDIMSPTVFNIVVDAVVNYCEAKFKTLHPNKELPKVLFYADDGVITGSDPILVQSMLDIYTNAFLRVGLKMNVAKTKSMIMVGRQCRTRTPRNEVNQDLTYKQLQATKVTCTKCNNMVGRSYLKRHQETQKCILENEKILREMSSTVHDVHTNNNSINTVDITMPNYCHEISVNGVNETSCPVLGCIFHTNKSYKMRQHFRNRHLESTIIIMEDGVNPLPKCPKCGIFQRDVGDRHQNTATCKQFALQLQIKCMQEQNVVLAQETTFTVFGETIENVHEFKYLGRIVTDSDEDKTTVIHNLNRAGKAWGQLHRLLSHEKKRNLKAVVSVYQAIIQAILLYGSETWVLQGSNTLHRLEIFHRRCARFLTGQYIHPQENGEWIYPSTEDVFQKAGLESIESYIQKRQLQVAKHLSPESKAMTDIANSLEIDINMERVSWC